MVNTPMLMKLNIKKNLFPWHPQLRSSIKSKTNFTNVYQIAFMSNVEDNLVFCRFVF